MATTRFEIPEKESKILIQIIKKSGGRVERAKKSAKGSYSISLEKMMMKKKEEKPVSAKALKEFEGTMFAKLSLKEQKEMLKDIQELDKWVDEGKFKNYKYTLEDFIKA